MLLRVTLVSLALVAGGERVQAADQLILGSKIVVKDSKPGDPTKRTIISIGKEKASSETIVGDPTVGGATLTIIANGDHPTTQTFPLPQGVSALGSPFWKASGSSGFKYRDAHGEQGPVNGVSMKRSSSGTFLIKAKVLGKNGAVDVLPPDLGTDGFMTLSLGGGDRYCVQYGPSGINKNKGAKAWQWKFPKNGPIEEACPTTTSTSTSSSTTTSSSTSTTTLPSQVCLPDRCVFVTKTAYTGNLGGLTGADDKCNAEAQAANPPLPGTYVAWVSDPSIDAPDRGIADAPYRRTDGTLVTDDLNDLLNGSIDAPINHDQDGVQLTGPAVEVWTGTRANGNSTDVDCLSWSTNDGSFQGTRGDYTKSNNQEWTNGGAGDCSLPKRLYCFQVTVP